MKKRKKSTKQRLRIGVILSLLLIIGTVFVIVFSFVSMKKTADKKIETSQDKLRKVLAGKTKIKLLKPNKYSRPQIKLKKVNSVVIHYTANPGTDAMVNRNYFNNLSEQNQSQGKNTYASSHFIVGLDGTIVQCIPVSEMSYASNQRNSDTLSIECCHPDASGKFTEATYESLTWLTASICNAYELSKDNIIRHYDITGKLCPKYFVEHTNEWEMFRADVMKKMMSK